MQILKLGSGAGGLAQPGGGETPVNNKGLPFPGNPFIINTNSNTILLAGFGGLAGLALAVEVVHDGSTHED